MIRFLVVVGVAGVLASGIADTISSNPVLLDWEWTAAHSIGFGNGTIIVVNGSVLQSLTLKGTKEWVVQLGKNPGTPMVSPASDGTIVVGSDCSLFGYDPEGRQKYKYDLGCQYYLRYHDNHTFLSDGTLVVCNHETLVALKPDGSEKWHHTYDHEVNHVPVVAPDDTMYTIWTGNLVALHANGTQKWHITHQGTGLANCSDCFSTSEGVGKPLDVAPDGTVYTVRQRPAAQNNFSLELLAIHPNSSIIWRHNLSTLCLQNASYPIGQVVALRSGVAITDFQACNAPSDRPDNIIILSKDGDVMFDDNEPWVEGRLLLDESTSFRALYGTTGVARKAALTGFSIDMGSKWTFQPANTKGSLVSYAVTPDGNVVAWFTLSGASSDFTGALDLYSLNRYKKVNWAITRPEPPIVRIKSRETGMCVELPNGDIGSKKTWVWQCSMGRNGSQLWRIQGQALQWAGRKTSKWPLQCVDGRKSKADGDPTVPGNTCNPWTYNSTSGRFWYLAGSDKMCMDLSSGGKDNGTIVQVWHCQDQNPNQEWDIETVPSSEAEDATGLQSNEAELLLV